MAEGLKERAAWRLDAQGQMVVWGYVGGRYCWSRALCVVGHKAIHMHAAFVRRAGCFRSLWLYIEGSGFVEESKEIFCSVLRCVERGFGFVGVAYLFQV